MTAPTTPYTTNKSTLRIYVLTLWLSAFRKVILFELYPLKHTPINPNAITGLGLSLAGPNDVKSGEKSVSVSEFFRNLTSFDPGKHEPKSPACNFWRKGWYVIDVFHPHNQRMSRILNGYSLSIFLDVEVKYCDGNCYSMTSYTPEYPYYKSHCHCCKAYKEKVKRIELECPPDADGVIKTVPHFVPDILECKCKKCDGHK